METLCVRCARLHFPRSKRSARVLTSNVRPFSSSKTVQAEGDRNPSAPRSQSQGQPLRGPRLPGTPLPRALRQDNPSSSNAQPGVMMRRLDLSGNNDQRAQSGNNASPATRQPRDQAGEAQRPGGPFQRTGARPPPRALLQRTGPPRPGQGTGQLLRRTGPQAGGDRPQRFQAQRTPNNRIPASNRIQGQSLPPLPNNARRPDDRVRKHAIRSTKAALAQDEDPDAFVAQDLPTQVNNYIDEIVDPPRNPTVELPHVPGASVDDVELRKDWPNTPLSGAGLVESVQQRIEWLAHRLPHGYQTTRQLAHHYASGNFTRFESEEERDAVLPVAREIAKKRADHETEKEQKEFQPMDMEFSDLVGREGESKGIADTWVKGVYPALPGKQQYPFLDQIARNLRGNESMSSGKQEEFMSTVRDILAARQGQASEQKVASK